MSEYMEDVRRYAPDASEETVSTIVKYCGIALRNKDSSLVSCSDKAERDRVRDGFCKKKLQLSEDAAGEAVEAVCQKMKEDRQKSRVTFYYLVAEHTGTLSKLS